MDLNDPYLRMNEERFAAGNDYLNMMSSPDFENLNREDEEARSHYVNIQVYNFSYAVITYWNARMQSIITSFDLMGRWELVKSEKYKTYIFI